VRYTVVFDTNILIAALLSTNGNPFRCLALARIGQVESVTCQEILDEFAEKLIVKFKFSQDMAAASGNFFMVLGRRGLPFQAPAG